MTGYEVGKTLGHGMQAPEDVAPHYARAWACLGVNGAVALQAALGYPVSGQTPTP